MNSCAMTLAEAGFEVVETKEDKGYIRFHLSSPNTDLLP